MTETVTEMKAQIRQLKKALQKAGADLREAADRFGALSQDGQYNETSRNLFRAYSAVFIGSAGAAADEAVS